VTEDDRLALTPVLVEDFNAVSGCDCIHGTNSAEAVSIWFRDANSTFTLVAVGVPGNSAIPFNGHQRNALLCNRAAGILEKILPEL
jgi:hypothetical protein